MKRALVTGAGGFLGRAIGAALRAARWDVVPLDRAAADVGDTDALLAHAVPADLVVHLAFPTRAAERRERPLDALRAVVRGAINVADLAHAAGAGHVLLASSGKVFGTPETLPIPDDHPVAPTTWLGELKVHQERTLALAARAAPFALTSLRIFNAWGPGQRDEFVIPKLLSAWRAGTPLRLGELDHRRDYVHADDVARACLVAAEDPPAQGRTRAWNVATGRATSVRHLIDLLTVLTGITPAIEQDPGQRRPDEPPDEHADCGALRARGWRPILAIEDGLRALLER